MAFSFLELGCGSLVDHRVCVFGGQSMFENDDGDRTFKKKTNLGWKPVIFAALIVTLEDGQIHNNSF